LSKEEFQFVEVFDQKAGVEFGREHAEGAEDEELALELKEF